MQLRDGYFTIDSLTGVTAKGKDPRFEKLAGKMDLGQIILVINEDGTIPEVWEVFLHQAFNWPNVGFDDVLDVVSLVMETAWYPQDLSSNFTVRPPQPRWKIGGRKCVG